MEMVNDQEGKAAREAAIRERDEIIDPGKSDREKAKVKWNKIA